MATSRVVWQGNPGEVWTNDTDRFKYQLICDLVHTCGLCLQYHLAISNWWPIPFHRNCRCSQVPIKPGQSARPFESYREVLRNLDPSQQAEAIGRSNYQLLDAGVVGWEDIVTETRVRTLKEVVAARKLSIDVMEKAGVAPRFAAEAHAAVHTPEQVLIRRHRKELVERIEAAGFSREQIVRGVAGQIHAKVAIAAGPSKSQAMPPPKLPPDLKAAFKAFGTGGQPPPQAPPPAPKPAPKPKTPPKPAAPAKVEPFQPPRTREERLKIDAAWRAGLTAEEKAGLQTYAGYGYTPINRYLRTGGIKQGLWKDQWSDEAMLNRRIAEIDSALAKARLDRPMVLYRGVTDLEALGLDPANVVGAEIADAGYLSTSMSKSAAKGFVQDEPDGALIRIEAPAGSPGGFLGEITNQEHEQEVLFARGTRLRITGTSREKGLLVLHAEMVHARP